MAHKEIWDAETLHDELGKAWDSLESIPNRYLKKIKRAIDLNVYYERQVLADRLANPPEGESAETVSARTQGVIRGLLILHEPISAVLNGTFESSGVDSELNADVSERYEENFGKDEYFDE